MKKTLIIGASTNPERYAYKAAQKLLEHGHEIVLLGKRSETLFDHPIHTQQEAFEGIDTVTLYLSPKFQEEYYDYIVSLNPSRVIFNPGTENPDLVQVLNQNNIMSEEACTLVLLATSQY